MCETDSVNNILRDFKHCASKQETKFAVIVLTNTDFKKLVEAHLLSESDEKHGFEKGCALIRANLGIDPTVGDYEDWATNYAQALWLEKWRLKNTAEMIAELFGGKG